MAIIVFQHNDSNRPGRLGATLRDHGFRLDVRELHQGDRIPADLDNVDGVVSLGGPQNVGEDHAWMEPEMAFLKAAHERGLPVVGVCLGAQLLGAALGGQVGPMNAPEIGMCFVDILPPGQTDTILAGIGWHSPQFQCHKYEVRELPPEATLLASSEACKVQAFRVGMRSYGFQYHFEADRRIMDEITKNRVSEFQQAGSSLQQFHKDVEQHYERFARLSDRLCLNIANYLIPRVANEILV